MRGSDVFATDSRRTHRVYTEQSSTLCSARASTGTSGEVNRPMAPRLKGWRRVDEDAKRPPFLAGCTGVVMITELASARLAGGTEHPSRRDRFPNNRRSPYTECSLRKVLTD